jgi:hypothetical protein
MIFFLGVAFGALQMATNLGAGPETLIEGEVPTSNHFWQHGARIETCAFKTCLLRGSSDRGLDWRCESTHTTCCTLFDILGTPLIA